MTTERQYKGVVVPMITPVTAVGEIDVPAVERIITFFANNGVSSLLMGTTGEGNSVSREQGLLLVQTAVKARNEAKAAGCTYDMTIYAGLTGTCVAEQIAAADAYTREGADVIVATLPSYYALTDEQMYRYYATLADSIQGSLMLYNISATTHMSIPLSVIERLSRHPNIVGLKDSERDLERMEQCIALARSNARFAYFCGWAAQSAHSLELGADGIVPSTGNYVPDLFRQLYDAVQAGDLPTAHRLQEETDRIAQMYQAGRTLGESLAALKAMMQKKGLCAPYMLPPLN